MNFMLIALFSSPIYKLVLAECLRYTEILIFYSYVLNFSQNLSVISPRKLSRFFQSSCSPLINICVLKYNTGNYFILGDKHFNAPNILEGSKFILRIMYWCTTQLHILWENIFRNIFLFHLIFRELFLAIIPTIIWGLE